MGAPTKNTPKSVNTYLMILSNGWCLLAVVVSTLWSVWCTKCIIQKGFTLCSTQCAVYAPIKSKNNRPTKTYNHKGMAGNQFKIPKLFAAVQSDVTKKKYAKGRLIMMVVMVKKMLGKAWRHFLYLTLYKGTMPSKIQKNVIPPTKNKLLCSRGILVK